MRIHFADASTDRGQLHLLADEAAPASLFSYAYKDARHFYEPFEQYWNELMNIHLVANPSGNSRIQQQALLNDSLGNHLMSYAYKEEEKEYTPILEKDLRPRVIIDSGAFTAWSTGKTINPKDYAEWALDFDKRWRHKMASLHFMNLDVIGDQDGTWKNQAILESLGMNPLPIITYGVNLSHLDRALQHYEYIALGGLVPWSRQRKKLESWLDACFSRVMKYKKETGIMRKIHLLGITTDWVLKRYPCFSSDSSSWVSCLRFGGGDAAGIKQLPRYKESDAAMAATIHTLRAEIRKYKRMEEEATKLWKTRGIIWDE